MTLTLELSPEIEGRVRAAAAAQGLTPEEFVAEAAMERAMTPAEIEALEDALDVAEAERILANTNASQWVSLDEARAHFASQRKP